MKDKCNNKEELNGTSMFGGTGYEQYWQVVHCFWTNWKPQTTDSKKKKKKEETQGVSLILQSSFKNSNYGCPLDILNTLQIIFKLI